jgi:hypothetical protein
MPYRLRLGRKGLVACSLVILAAVTGLIYRADQVKKPIVVKDEPSAILALTKVTSKLYSDAAALQSSFNNKGTPAELTKGYLDNLRALESGCKQVDDIREQAKQFILSDKTADRLKETLTICDDLNTALEPTRASYEAVEPLMAVRSMPKRYESLGPFKSRKVSRDKAAIQTAQTQLTQVDAGENDFPGFVTMKQDMDKVSKEKVNSSYGYLKVVKEVQLRWLGDRINYWTSYVDLNSLKTALQSQRDNYCALGDKSRLLPECK